jgi:hypothetical protein
MKEKLLVILYFITAFVVFLNPIDDTDFYWHLKTGEYIVKNMEIPQDDPFTFPHEGLIKEKEKFILSQYWLAQVIYYGVYSIGGLKANALYNGLLTFSIFFFIWLALKEKGMYYVIIFSIPATFIIFASIRDSPQNYSSLFSFVILFLVEKYRRDPSQVKALFFIPLLMLLWANLHGGFAFGVAVLIIYSLTEFSKFLMAKKNIHSFGEPLESNKLILLLLTAFIAILVSFINPNGAEAVQRVIPHSGYGAHFKSVVYEYQSVLTLLHDPDNPKFNLFTFWFYFGYMCIVVLFSLVRKKKIDITAFVLLAFTGAIALSAIRYMIFFLATTLFFIKDYPFFKEDIFKREIFQYKFTYAVFLLIVLYGTGSSINSLRASDFTSMQEDTIKPVRAAQFLKSLPISGNVFNAYNKGGFLIWATWPQYKMFYDTREMDYQIIRDGNYISYGLRYKSEIYKYAVINSLASVLPKEHQSRIAFSSQDVVINGKPLWKYNLDYYNADIIVHNALNILNGQLYPLILYLMNDDEWSLIYSDGNVLIFLKNKPKYKELIDRYKKPKEIIYDQIISEAALGLQIKSLFSYYYSNMGFAYIMKNEYDRARMLIDTALALNENDIAANFSDLYLTLLKQMEKESTHQS